MGLGFNPGLTAANGQPANSGGGGGGFGWNPLTDFMNATSSVGNFVDAHTHIGNFNPGLGGLASGLLNFIPGMANIVTQGLEKGDTSGITGAIGSIGTGFKNTATDVTSLGGLLRNPLSNEIGGQTAMQAATSPGQGLAGALFNDVANFTMAADGAGALMKGDAIGAAADGALKADTAARVSAIDGGATPDLVEQAGQQARTDAVQHAIDSQLKIGGDPEAVRQQVLDRMSALENIDKFKNAVQLPMQPWKAIRPLERAAGSLLGGPEEPISPETPSEAPGAPQAVSGTEQRTTPENPAAPQPGGASPLQAAMDEAVASQAKTGTLTEERPPAEISQAEKDYRAGKFGDSAGRTGNFSPEPMTTVYRGEAPGNAANAGEGGEARQWATTSEAHAREMYAGNGGQVLQQDVPTRVLKELDKGGGDVRGNLVNGAGEMAPQYKLPEEYKDRWQPQGQAKPADTSFISQLAAKYAKANGLSAPKGVDTTAKANPTRGKIISKLYEKAKSDPNDPKVKAAYQAFASEVAKQWDFLKKQGVKVDFVDRAGQGVYANADEMIADVRDNKHLSVDRTGPGEQHLMPEMNAVIDHDAAGNPITVNDAFRAVHDYFGHAQAGNTFDRNGEDIAWRLHEQMFSDKAKPALFTETVGQNSYLNFSDASEALRAAGKEAQFPEQKAALLPEDVRRPDYNPRPEDLPSNEGTANAKLDAVVNRITNVPRAYTSYLEASKPIPDWATRAVDRMPLPLQQVLAWMDGHHQRLDFQAMTRQQQRAVATSAKEIEVRPEVKALKRKAVDIIQAHYPGVTPTVASNIVGQLVRSYITKPVDLIEQLEGNRQALEEALPGKGSLLTDAQLGYTFHIPDELNTPEFRQSIYNLADPIKQLRIEASNRLLQSQFLADKGLKGVDSDMPALTQAEKRTERMAMLKLKQAANLEAVKVPKELAGVAKDKVEADDVVGQTLHAVQAADQAAKEATVDFDRSRFVPSSIDSPQKIQAVTQEMVQRTLDSGGATFNPTSGKFINAADGTTQGYLVGALPGSVLEMPLDQFQAEGAAAIQQVMHSYQEALAFPNITIGTWADSNGIVHIDPSQFLEGQSARDHALTLGAVRNQQAVLEVHTGDELPVHLDPNASAYFVAKHQARDARAMQLRNVADQQIAAGGRGLSPDDIDRNMAFFDRMAVQQSLLHPDVYKSADDVYKTTSFEFAQKSSPADRALNEIRPMLRDPATLKNLVRDVIARAAPESRWYFDAHDYIEKAGNQLGDIQLGFSPFGEPKTVSGKELLYDMVAIHSMNTDPAQNWIWALGGVRNWVGINKSDLKTLTQAVKEWVKLPPEKRTPISDKIMPPALIKLLKNDTNQLARRYYLAVLDGHTVDSWDADFFRPGGAFEQYGNTTKKTLSEKNIPQAMIDRLGRDTAVMEYHGSPAAAKIRSFRDNLRNPDTSMSVTLDSWMARLFGEGDTWWGNANRWHEYAEKIRGIASDLSGELGRQVMPHEVQAALWFWIKQNYSDVNSAAIRGMGIDTLSQIDKGAWNRASDPLGQFWSEAEDHARTVAARGENPAPLRTMKTTSATSLEPEQVFEGGKLPETHETQVNYRFPRASQKTGKLTEDGNSIVLAHQEYNDVMDKVEQNLAAGKVDEAKYAVWNYIHQSDKEWDARKEGLQFWDAPSRPSWPGFHQTLADTLGIHIDSGTLNEFRDQLYGQFVPRTSAAGGTIRLFQHADFATLLHEEGHLLRQLTTGDDAAALEKAYGVQGHKWTSEAEEAFVHDFLASASDPKFGAVPEVMARLKDNLAEAYGSFGEPLHPEIDAFWQKVLAPNIPHTEVPGYQMSSGEKLLGVEGTTEAGKTMAQRLQMTPKPAEGKFGTYQRGARGQEAVEKYRQALQAKQAASAAYLRAQSHVEDLEKVINSRLVPSQILANRLRASAVSDLDKLDQKLADPAMSRVPPQWQPMVTSAKRLAEDIKAYPELEPILAGLPQTFGQALDFAAQHGFTPEYMPDLTAARVRDLVAGTAKLGNQGTDQFGKEFTSGARRQRRGTLQRMGAFDNSIDALVAGLNQAVQEDRTNQIVDWIDRVAARDLPVNKAGVRLGAPPGWVEWDATRRGMLAVDTPQERLALGANKMIPRPVAQALREYSGAAPSNPFYRGMKMITDPWRQLYLTLNPGFYMRHFTGHVMLAAIAGGVDPKAWAQAFTSMRNHFDDLPEVTGLSITNAELGQPGLVEWPSLADAMQVGGRREALGYISNKIHAAISTSDSFARAVAYYSQHPTTEFEKMKALQYAQDALVDYGNMSNTEKYMVRSLVPFYSFSKGILKIAYRMPMDHPLAAALILHIGQWQQEQAKDDNGNPLPERYQGVVDLPLLGKVDLQKFSPFKDLSALTSADGLVSSLQYAVQDVVRAGLGVPAPGTKASLKVDQYGRLVPDVSLGSQLQASFTGGPQGQLFEGLTGQGKGLTGSIESFFGVPVTADTTLNNAGARNVVSQAEVGNMTQAQQQQAAASPVDTQQAQQNLQTALASGNPLNLPQSAPGQAPVTQQQVQQQVQAALQKQQQKAALTRATKPKRSSGGGAKRSSGGSHRSTVGRVHVSVHRASARIKSSGGGHVSSGHGARAASTRSRVGRIKISRQALGKAANKVRSGGGAPAFKIKSGRRGVATGHKRLAR